MPLTKEEKKKRKAEKKAKKLREAEELRIKLRKDHLLREIGIEEYNTKLLHKKWNDLCKAAKLPEIREDMETTWRNFEYTLDIKDFIINQMVSELDEANMVDRVNYQNHVDSIDKLLEYCNRRVNAYSRCYKQDFENLLERKIEENKQIREKQDNDVEYVKTVIFAARENFKETLINVQADYVTKSDDLLKKNKQDMEMLSGNLENKIDQIVKELKRIFVDYHVSTEDLKKQVDALQEKDNYFMDMIRKQNNKILKVSEEINQLQMQFSEVTLKKKELQEVQSERDRVYQNYLSLRNEINEGSETDSQHLLQLATTSNTTIQHLERLVEKGEKILRYGDICRKLETQREKIIPFEFPFFSADAKNEAYGNLQLLEKFWRRIGIANLKRMQMEVVAQKLQHENNWLQEQLHTVFGNMTLTSSCVNFSEV